MKHQIKIGFATLLALVFIAVMCNFLVENVGETQEDDLDCTSWKRKYFNILKINMTFLNDEQVVNDSENHDHRQKMWIKVQSLNESFQFSSKKCLGRDFRETFLLKSHKIRF